MFYTPDLGTHSVKTKALCFVISEVKGSQRRVAGIVQNVSRLAHSNRHTLGRFNSSPLFNPIRDEGSFFNCKKELYFSGQKGFTKLVHYL